MYKNILWVYKSVQKMYGITVSQNFIICLSNGEKIQIQLKEADAARFIGEFVLPENPDVICGFSYDREKKYRELIKEIKKRGFDNWERERFGNVHQSNFREFYDESLKEHIGRKKITLVMAIIVTVLLVGPLLNTCFSKPEVKDVVKGLESVSVSKVESWNLYSLDEAKIVDFYGCGISIFSGDITDCYYIATYKNKNGKDYCFALRCPYDEDNEDNINLKYLEALGDEKKGEIPLSGNFVLTNGIDEEKEFYNCYNESIKGSGVEIAKFTLRFASEDEIKKEEDKQLRDEEILKKVASFLLVGLFIISACCVTKKIIKIKRMKKMLDE